MERSGGILSLTVRRVGLASIAEDLETPDDLESRECVCISVADTGHGMTPEIRDRVFEPYFTTKTKTRGTGLGLATVFGIVRDLGGTIRVQSEVSVGTQFDVYVPASTKPAETILEEDSPVTVDELGIENILVIDDEPSNIRMLDRVLSTFGARVTGFTNPREALLHLRESSRDYDVMITDLTMPGMTGIELTQQLRTFDRYLPVIVYTGYGDEKNEANAIAAGARMMIRKPGFRTGEIRRPRAYSATVGSSAIAVCRAGSKTLTNGWSVLDAHTLPSGSKTVTAPPNPVIPSICRVWISTEASHSKFKIPRRITRRCP
jgi:CheY-like chemotaxis protein